MSIERLLAAAAACSDAELAYWLAEVCRKIQRGLPPAHALDIEGTGARRRRNALVRTAADQLEGSTWRRSQALAGVAAALGRRSRRRADGLTKILIEADHAARLPTTARAFFNILRATEGQGAETSEKPGENNRWFLTR